MWKLWFFRGRSSASYDRPWNFVPAKSTTPLPAMDTSFVIGQIIADFGQIISNPPADGNYYGNYADYSCNTPRDRAEYGLTIYLNRKMPDVSMPDVVDAIAREAEMRGCRVKIDKGITGDPEIRVSNAFRNTDPY